MAPRSASTRTALFLAVGTILAAAIVLVVIAGARGKSDVAPVADGAQKYANLARAVSAIGQARPDPKLPPAPEPPPECTTCEKRNCDPQMVGCEALRGEEDRATCLAVLSCVRQTGCAKNGIMEPCLCGSAPFQECLLGSANGPCKELIEMAGKSTAEDPVSKVQQTAERYFNPQFPLGRALNLVGCDHESCKQPCSAVTSL